MSQIIPDSVPELEYYDYVLYNFFKQYQACCNSRSSKCKRYFPKGQGILGFSFLCCSQECADDLRKDALKKYGNKPGIEEKF